MARRKKILEKFDKDKNQWIEVSFSEANDEAIRIYEIMEAHLEISTVEEAIKLDIDVKEKN